MKKTFVVSMVLTGAFIGAGFASGQELLQYFGIFGKYAIFGVSISCVLLSFFVYCVADNIVWMGEKEYINELCSCKWMNSALECYMLLIFSAMITAFGETLEQIWNFPKMYGVVIIDLVTCVILCFGAKGIINFNSIVTPLIIVGIVFSFFVSNSKEVFLNNNFVTSAIVYTSYNIVSTPFVLVEFKDTMKTAKSKIMCSVMFGGIIFILAVCMLGVLKNADANVAVPLLSVVDGKYTVAIVVVLALSMVTTAVSNGYGFVENISINKNITILFLGIFGVVFSILDFSYIVGNLYSLFGFLGFYIIMKNFYIFIKNREKPQKTEKIINN